MAAALVPVLSLVGVLSVAFGVAYVMGRLARLDADLSVDDVRTIRAVTVFVGVLFGLVVWGMVYEA